LSKMKWIRVSSHCTGLLVIVSITAGCARDDSGSGTRDAASRFEQPGLEKAQTMPPLPQPQSPKIQGAAADENVTGGAVLRFVRHSAGSYFYAASESDRESIVGSNADVRFEKALFQISPAGPDAVPVHRFFRTDGSGHFLTASATERDAIGASRAHSHFQYEGVAFFAAPQEVPGALPVYRLSSNANGAYLYTQDGAERAAAVQSGNWLDEGIGFHALPAGRRILTGSESAERQRLEQLEARLAKRQEERSGAPR